MSRGFWDYRNEYLQSDIFGWNVSKEDGLPNIFEDKEITEIIFDMFRLLYAFDSYKCGDWSEKSWLEEKDKFKERWLGRTEDERVRAIVESTLADAKNEIFKTFGLEDPN